MFAEGDLFNSECLSLLLSKVLGYLIVAASTIIKLPQISRIIDGKSAAGLSALMFILENIGYTIGLSYNFNSGFPFSTYGENLFVLIQGIVLIFLIFYYNNKLNATFAAGLALYVVFASTMLGGIIPLPVQKLLQTATIGIFISARVPQILANYNNRGVGKLDPFMVVMNFGGSIARIFTTLKEVPDSVALYSYIIGASLNGVLLGQIAYYGKAKKN